MAKKKKVGSASPNKKRREKQKERDKEKEKQHQELLELLKLGGGGIAEVLRERGTKSKSKNGVDGSRLTSVDATSRNDAANADSAGNAGNDARPDGRVRGAVVSTMPVRSPVVSTMPQSSIGFGGSGSGMKNLKEKKKVSRPPIFPSVRPEIPVWNGQNLQNLQNLQQFPDLEGQFNPEIGQLSLKQQLQLKSQLQSLNKQQLSRPHPTSGSPNQANRAHPAHPNPNHPLIPLLDLRWAQNDAHEEVYYRHPSTQGSSGSSTQGTDNEGAAGPDRIRSNSAFEVNSVNFNSKGSLVSKSSKALSNNSSNRGSNVSNMGVHSRVDLVRKESAFHTQLHLKGIGNLKVRQNVSENLTEKEREIKEVKEVKDQNGQGGGQGSQPAKTMENQKVFPKHSPVQAVQAARNNAL